MVSFHFDPRATRYPLIPATNPTVNDSMRVAGGRGSLQQRSAWHGSRLHQFALVVPNTRVPACIWSSRTGSLLVNLFRSMCVLCGDHAQSAAGFSAADRERRMPHARASTCALPDVLTCGICCLTWPGVGCNYSVAAFVIPAIIYAAPTFDLQWHRRELQPVNTSSSSHMHLSLT
jgi:hypothetical protein